VGRALRVYVAIRGASCMAKRTIVLLVLLLQAVGHIARAQQCPDGTPPPCRAVAPRAPAPNSVAVLSFSASDTADRYLAEGISENVATSLGGVRGVQVKPWSLVRRVQRASGGNHRQMAEALGVRYVVDGLLIRVGTHVRLAVEVIDAQSGSAVLGEAYVSAPDSLPALAATVARDVAPYVGARRQTTDVKTRVVVAAVAGLFNGVATIAGAVIFVWGVVVLAVGRFKARGSQLRGRTARISGLFLVLQLPLAVAINWPLYNALNHGDQVAIAINRSIAGAIVWGFFAVAGVVCAKIYARANVPAGGGPAPQGKL